MIVVNKWDAVEKDEKTMKEFEQKIRDHFLFLSYAPIVFLSAKTKKRIHTLMPMINTASENHASRVDTSILNDVIMDAVAMNPTPTDNGRRLKIYYTTQVAVKPPTFVVFVNEPELLHFSYERFLENRIRDAFGFEGTPIKIFRKRKKVIDKKGVIICVEAETVAVVGAGSWGTALAIVLADNGHEVRLWGHKPNQIEEINQEHTNKKYLPDIHLPENIIGYSSLEDALSGLEIIVLAVPTKAIREVLGKIKEFQKHPLTIVHVSKGIEPDSLMRISEMIEEELPCRTYMRVLLFFQVQAMQKKLV